MNDLWNFIDTAPILDLAYLSIFLIAIAVLIGWAIHTIVTERRYAKKRKRLIELAGGVSSSSRDRQHAGVSSGAASPSDLASRPQDFDNDHPGRERLGLRRGK